MHYTTRFAPETIRQAVIDGRRRGLGVGKLSAIYRVSRTTVYRWIKRNNSVSRSSRPLRQPRRTPEQVEAAVAQVRSATRWGPDRIAMHLQLPGSTVYKILVRLGVNKLASLHELPAAGPRYEYAQPGGLLHVDVKALSTASLVNPRLQRQHGQRREFLHVMLDDHSRVVYAEVQPDEHAATASAVLERGLRWFASLGVNCQRVLTDNGPAYTAYRWRDTCQLLGLRHLRTRPRRPQTNGKCERWNRTLTEEVLNVRSYPTALDRAVAIEQFVCYYNTRRPHTALDGKMPFHRLLKV
jgi:transposase InsO family protein